MLLDLIINSDPFLLHVSVIIFSLIILFFAADLIIESITHYSRKLGLSDYLTGLVVVSTAASMPEMVSSITGLRMGQESILIGTLLGSNMVHMALLTGIMLYLGGRLNLECKILENAKLFLWLLILLPFILGSDGRLSRTDGIVLVLAYIAYIGVLIHKEGALGKIKQDVPFRSIWRDCVVFLGSLTALVMAGRWLVFSGVQVASMLELPSYFIALTIIGIGGAFPDLAVELRSLLRGHQQVGMGDAIGSTVMEFLLFIGIIAIITPITFGSEIISGAFLFLLSFSLVLLFIHRKTVTRAHGLVLISCYIAFLLIEIWRIF